MLLSILRVSLFTAYPFSSVSPAAQQFIAMLAFGHKKNTDLAVTGALFYFFGIS